MKKVATHNWGFNTASIDRSVRPQDDFYRFANGMWLKKNIIPHDEARWGAFSTLRLETEHHLKSIVEELLKKHYKKSSPEQQIADLFCSAMDMKRRNALGVRPILSERKSIRALSSVEEVVAYAARSHRIGGSALWSVGIDQDLKDSSRFLLQLAQGGLGLPERDYYLIDAPEQKRVREAYKKYIEKLLRLSGLSAWDASRARKVVMNIETFLANISMDKIKALNVDLTYHKVPFAHVDKESGIAFKTYLKEYGASFVHAVNLVQPEFFRALARLLRSVPLEEWKLYLEWHLVADCAPLLSEPFIKASFDFWGRTVSGSRKIKPLWRRSLGAVNGALGEPLGKLYAEKYFGTQAKRVMNKLVDDLFAAYEKRIRGLDWMSPATRNKAIAKLRAMGRKIGYPERWRSYRGLTIRANDFFGNMLRANEYEHARAMRRLNRSVNRKEWITLPQVVNAFANFGLNDINFPAAILQWPFFDLSADMAINYAAIGSIIGHEMTHGFDDQGSKFDAKGNRHEWWGARDRKKYHRKAQLLVRQFNKYEAAGGVMVNGKLTLGENIADLGGLAIAYDAYQKYLSHHGRKTIDNFSPEERFFLGFAQQERELVRKEFEKMAALTDTHSPGVTRVNGPLSNFEPFYRTFRVSKKHKMYRAFGARTKIW